MARLQQFLERFSFKPRYMAYLVLVLGVTGLAAFAPSPVYAQGIGTTFADWIAQIFLGFAYVIGHIATTFIGILIQIVQYKGFINAPAVIKGWVVVRDVANMFFIVILLLLAFGSVFRIEEYTYKHHLGKLLLMAVLVNFSKSVAGFFIDLAQVVMLTFVNGFKDAAAGNFLNGFKLNEMFKFAETSAQGGQTSVSGLDFMAAAFLALVTISIATVVVGVYIVVFALRIVILWILIVISPLAYLLAGFPGDAKKYSSQWWDYFGKYVTSGPILAFFLWLSLAVMQLSQGALNDFTVKGATDLPIPAATITGIGQSETLLSFIISIALLVAGLWMTQQLGVAGGKLAAGALSAIQKGGGAIAKSGARGFGLGGYVARKYSEKAPAWANPAAMVRGFIERRNQVREETKAISTARVREFVTKALTGGRQQIPYEQLARRGIESKHSAEYAHMTKEQKAFAASKLVKKGLLGGRGGEETQRLFNALSVGAGAESHNDDIIASDYFKYDHEWTDREGRKQKGLAVQVDPQGQRHYEQRGRLKQEQIDQGWRIEKHSQRIVGDYWRDVLRGKDGPRVAHDIGEAMAKAGHPQGREVARTNMRTGGLEWREQEEWRDDALNELSKQQPREQLKAQIHASKVMMEDPTTGETYWGRGEADSFEEQAHRRMYEHTETGALNQIRQFAVPRSAAGVWGYNMHNTRLELTDMMMDDLRLLESIQRFPGMMRSTYENSGARGIVYRGGRYGARQEYGSADEFMHDPRWGIPPPPPVTPPAGGGGTGPRGGGGGARPTAGSGGVGPRGGGPAGGGSPRGGGGGGTGGGGAPGGGDNYPPGTVLDQDGKPYPPSGGGGPAAPGSGPTPRDSRTVLAVLDPDGSVQNELWEKHYAEEERKSIIQQVRTKTGTPDMPEEEARREYFAQGLANETESGDKSETAIKLKPEARDTLVAGVAAALRSLQQPVEAIKSLAQKIASGATQFSPEELQLQSNYSKELEGELQKIQAKADKSAPVAGKASEAEGINGQVRVALQNTVSVGGMDNLMNELARPGHKQERFFKPLLVHLRKEFEQLFKQQSSLSGDMLTLRKKLNDLLTGL